MRLAWVVAVALVLPVSAAAQTLERVRDSGVLKIGYREDAAPYSYKNAIGQPAGYTVALCQAVATDIADRGRACRARRRICAGRHRAIASAPSRKARSISCAAPPPRPWSGAR